MNTLLITDRDYLTSLKALLSQARKSIDILAFSFAIGSATGRLNVRSSPYAIAQDIKKLKERYGTNIRVRLYMEGVRETVDRNRVTAHFLEQAGVEVRLGATHAKGFCVDSRYVLFGSTNLTEQSIARNNEANVLVDDVGVAQEFKKYFQHLWKGGEHGGVTLKPPLLADGAFKDVLVSMADRSQKKLEFSIYFFSHPEIEAALITAHRRGVSIVGFIHQHDSFALPYIYANRSTVKKLRAAGLKKLHFSVPSTFSHSKYLIMDRSEVLIGTGNWLVQDVVTHPQLYAHFTDKKLAAALAAHLHRQLKSQATTD